MQPTRLETPAPPAPKIAALEEIASGGCGRCFRTIDGPGMLAVIVGSCPDCGGSFGLSSASP